MKKIYILFAALTLLSCKSTEDILKNGKPYENFRGFEPVDPTEHEDEVDIVVEENGIKKIVPKYIKLLSREETLSFLNNETSIVSIGQIDIQGGITYLPINISAKHSSYKITMDYMKSTTIGQEDQNGPYGYKRVGVGLRLIAMITTSKANLNIGDISTIGAAVMSGEAHGTLMAECIGIKSKEVTALFPWPSEINQTTVQNAAMALATIKSKIYDSETELFPQVVAVKTLFDNCNCDKVKIEKLKDSILTTNTIAKSTQMADKIKLQFENNKINPKTSLATGYESDGFAMLLAKNIDESLIAFKNCYSIYPTFHNCDEIKQLLQANKNVLKDPTNSKWKDIYKDIITHFSSGLSPKLINQLRTASQ
ncbi:hypothetical protein BC749_10954 [Flavobacterium araucananum]|uniref:Lipoprotein n=1 Tax=Flavobacterium araucananum TaxID=946678 RepID=A0A227P7Q9_9FLAO|nr:hypothetical protein [Flavobacterium araucananum]OXG05065.1 hypothetical protein B0A64_13615 [Flavobacterium araucananum]PWJ96778.1 hypothetical protein BC749_10954 [Flavobacterium araucananum]